MSDFQELSSIMTNLREEDSHVVVDEQSEIIHRGEQEDLTELQQDLMEQRQMEEELADREPQVHREAI